MFGKNQQQNSQPDFEVFVIFDSKVGIYRQPLFAINKHDILREFDRTFRDPKESQNQYLTNAEDFSIFKIGEYSKRTGVITPNSPEHIANLHDIRSSVMRTIPLRDDAPMRNVTAQQQQLGIVPT